MSLDKFERFTCNWCGERSEFYAAHGSSVATSAAKNIGWKTVSMGAVQPLAHTCPTCHDKGDKIKAGGE